MTLATGQPIPPSCFATETACWDVIRYLKNSALVLHVLLALLDQQGGSVRHLLTQANVNVNALRSQLGLALDQLPQVQGAGGDVQISNELGRHLNLNVSRIFQITFDL